MNASPRDLARRPRLLRSAVVVWSAFVGAVLLTALLALTPDAWLLPPVHMRDQALMFLVLWLASTVPAGFATLLLAPRKEG